MTKKYLSRTEFAHAIGVAPGTLSRYRLPKPDATIGAVRGWTPATVQHWQAARRGRGWKHKEETS